MPRRVAGPKPGGVREYIPRALGNDKAQGDEQVRVWIKNPTEHEKREANASVRLPDESADGIDTRHVISRVAVYVDRFVERVENYEGPGGEAITDGPSLVRHGETLMLIDIANEIEHGLSLTADELGNSVGPSDSSGQVTSPCNGTVPNADVTASMNRETAAVKAAPALSI